MAYTKIKVEYAHDRQILKLVLNSPKGNVLDGVMMTELTQAIRDEGSLPGLKALVFSGTGTPPLVNTYFTSTGVTTTIPSGPGQPFTVQLITVYVGQEISRNFIPEPVGWMQVTTELARDQKPWMRLVGIAMLPFMKTAAQGAATTLYAAVRADPSQPGASYLADCAPARASRPISWATIRAAVSTTWSATSTVTVAPEAASREIWDLPAMLSSSSCSICRPGYCAMKSCRTCSGIPTRRMFEINSELLVSIE